MKLLKRAAAALLSVCTALTCASCGENTANAMKVSDYNVRAGIYLYYVVNAYSDAVSELTDQGEKFDDVKETKDIKKIVKKINLDGVTVEEWIQNKAVEYCQTFVAVEKEFDRLGMTLDGSELAQIDNTVASNMASYGEFFDKTGIGEQSVRDIVTSSLKQSKLWDAYYGEGGSKEIKEDTLKDYYADNHLRIKYIEMPLKDGEGNLLKADGKAEIEKMAKDYLARLEKKQGSEKDLMAEFDYLIDEHNNYVTSLSQAAITTTDDEGNPVTTATTAKSTTTETKATTEDQTSSAGDGDATTTSASEEETTTTTTTLAEDQTGEGTTTTAADGQTGDSTTTTTTAEAASDNTGSADVTTSGTETTEDTTTTTTAVTNSVGYDTGKERVLAVSTSASEEEKKEDETTTAPTYTPCEKVYNWAVDPATKYLEPEFIQDDECYYIAVKMDIRDRMTDDDLWTESRIESVRQELYYDEFLDMLNGMGKELSVERNKSAFRRYHVLDVDLVGYQTLLYQSYYSSMGYSG